MPPRPPPRLPHGTKVYAVGDVHGRVDLLGDLHAGIAADLAASRPARSVIVYLGDYVDRGPDSSGVLDLLLDRKLPAEETVHLLGNHERILLEFLERPEVGANWLLYGGVETLASYGIEFGGIGGIPATRLARARDLLAERLPAHHLAFLAGLKTSHEEGDYFFAHAGVRPGVPLARQTEDDLIWIREEFLASSADHGKIVVHGHTIREQPEVKPNRIGIDTGAFWTGRLTALVLEGERVGFLETGA